MKAGLLLREVPAFSIVQALIVTMHPLKNSLEKLYEQYNRRRYVHPDPLEFLYKYREARDREIVGMIASALAYGKVQQILKSVAKVLEPLGKSPADAVPSLSDRELEYHFSGFKHRFTTGDDIISLIVAMRNVLREYGSMEACFLEFFHQSFGETISALSLFVDHLKRAGGIESSFLLPSPEKGSACKRLFLYLRWMVRSDEVDPGGWDGVPAGALFIPLDTHMFHIASSLGFVSRKQADLRAAIEITNNFIMINPEDPVKYDFVLTRFGIRDELDRNSLAELLPSEPLL